MFRYLVHIVSKRRRAFGMATLSGFLYFYGFGGFGYAYLAWVCLVPVLQALDDATLSGWEALLIAWTFGTVTQMGGYTWLMGMLQDFGHLPLPLATAGYMALCVGQGFQMGVWGWVLNRLVSLYGCRVVWVAPTALVTLEWLWPALFPSYLANSQYRFITFIQALDLVGPLGLSFVVASSSAVIHDLLAALQQTRPRSIPFAPVCLFLLLVAANLAYGVGALSDIDETVAHADDRLKVGLVQVNMGIYEKHQKPLEGLRRHRDQSLEIERQGVDLIVWPESGFNFAIPSDTNNVKNSVLGKLATPVIFGGLRVREGETRHLYNTAFAADGDGNILGTYDKTYLLAFGEYLPLGDVFPALYKLSPHTTKFDPGSHTEPLVIAGVSYGILICYEDILPRFVAQVMAHSPDVLVNLTNDAWFGKSAEPRIHLALATFRAVESRRFLLRATNTGISAIVDPAGRIVDQTPIFTRANLTGEIASLSGQTFYGAMGDWVAWLCTAVLLGIPLCASARRYVRRAGVHRSGGKPV